MNIWSAICKQKGCALDPITVELAPTHCPVCGNAFSSPPEKIASDLDPEVIEHLALGDEPPEEED